MRARPPVLAVPSSVRPEIVCPDWCVVDYDHHYEDLGEHDGFVIHHSEGGSVWHSRCAYPDNTVDPDEPPMIWIDAPEGVTIEQAEALAAALLRAIGEARA